MFRGGVFLSISCWEKRCVAATAGESYSLYALLPGNVCLPRTMHPKSLWLAIVCDTGYWTRWATGVIQQGSYASN